MRFPALAALALSSALAATCAIAQDAPVAPVKPATTTPAKPSPPVPLLWKVSDADNAVYLLGSFHLLKPADYPLSPDVDAAFADAERLVFEMAPQDMASPSLALDMQKAALRSDGGSLKGDLGAELWAKLERYAAANGLPVAMLSSYEPWFVGLMVSLTEMSKFGLDPKLGLDAHMAAEAGKANKPASGLETPAQQIALLDSMSREEQLQFVDEVLDESAEGRAELEKLHAAWRNGDEKTMWEGMAAEMKREYPKLYRHINVERNDAWVPKIEQRLKSDRDDTLVVVGSLHLLGSDGVVEKLRARGYTVERICSACKASRKQ